MRCTSSDAGEREREGVPSSEVGLGCDETACIAWGMGSSSGVLGNSLGRRIKKRWYRVIRPGFRVRNAEGCVNGRVTWLLASGLLSCGFHQHAFWRFEACRLRKLPGMQNVCAMEIMLALREKEDVSG